MDLRTQTSLLASVLCLAIAAQVLLPPRRRKTHLSFALFTGTVAVWYLSAFLLRFLGGGAPWHRFNLICSILLPVAAVRFFNGFAVDESKRAKLLYRVTVGVALILLVVVCTPFYGHVVVAGAVFAYVCLSLFPALFLLYTRADSFQSPFMRARLRYLALVGALAAAFTVLDYLPYFGFDIPPIGSVLILVFLYLLAQSILLYRLIDLYELAGRLAVLTGVSFVLAAIFWLVVTFSGGRFFLQAVVAALVVLLVYDPVRTKVHEKISQFFFSRRYALEQSILELRRRLTHAREIEDIVQLIMDSLEQSRRFTHASIHIIDDAGRGYDLAGSVGPAPAAHIGIGSAKRLFDLLQKQDAVALEEIQRNLNDSRAEGDNREAETLCEIIQTMEAMRASLCVPVRRDQQIYGILSVRDERIPDAFSPEEVQMLVGLAVQIGVAVENSRAYQRLRTREQLAAVGEMAAGLAHEIRNPLGSIKATAQYLAEPVSISENESHREFLNIIVEEADRLDRVVSSLLDYVRPSQGNPAPIDANAVIRRTLQLIVTGEGSEGVETNMILAEDLPPVNIDAEQLRQVLINLVRNAIQAMEGKGNLDVETKVRGERDTDDRERRWVEIRVSDTGPGIPKKILDLLFVPFVTTKQKGTGLGLAISQRIVASAGGHIEVHSHGGAGTTFVVRLPASEAPAQS